MKYNNVTKKRNRSYAQASERPCRARGSHDDAVALVDFLLQNGGKTDIPAEQLAQTLGWEQRLGSARMVDMGRFQRARNHVKDGTAKDGKPCTGFRLHYRTSARENEWMLVDPSGGLPHHREVATREIQGDLQQQVAFRTINGRRIATAHAMGEMCLQSEPSDVPGYQLMTRYAMELERFGAASDGTIAEMALWLQSV